jgi:hypothetical protein
LALCRIKFEEINKKMKKIFLNLFLMTLTTTCYFKAFSQNASFVYEWNANFGVNGADDQTNSVIYDSQGNLYQTGYQNVTVGNVFVQKLNSAGASQWQRLFQGISGSFNTGLGVALDGSDNVLVTGSFQNTLNVIGGSTLISNGTDDIFIVKYNSSGAHQWSFSLGGANLDQGLAVTTDQNDNVLITGYFIGTVDFDPSASTANLSSMGAEDVFVAKYDSNGNYLWAINMGSTSGSNLGNSIVTDALNNVYVTGQFFGTVDFAPGVATSNLTATGSSADAFVAKYNSLGTHIWSFKLGGIGSDVGSDLSIDSSGDLFVTGSYQNTVDFNPLAPVNSLTTLATKHPFLAKYDGAGNYAWAIDIAGNSKALSYGLSISSNVENEIGVTGYFIDSLNASTNLTLKSNGAGDIYTAIYTKTGVLSKAFSLGGTGWDISNTIDISNTNKIFIGGSFSNTVDFDPSAANLSFNAGTGTNGFATQYGAPPCVDPDIPTVSASINTLCLGSTSTLSIITGGLNDADNWFWYESNCGGSAVGTGTAVTVAPASTTTYYVRGEGNCVTTSTCASISLTVHFPSFTSDSQVACNEYIWIDGNTYTSNNTSATYTLTNLAGCDSIITLNLIINSIDTSVTINSNILTSNQSGATYQWIDCNNGNSNIVGATNQSYTISGSGNYAVVVAKNNCIDTSACKSFVSTGLTKTSISDIEIMLYPNPTSGSFSINTNDITTIEIYSVLGETIYSEKQVTNPQKINIDSHAEGFYFVKISVGEKVNIKKLLLKK